MAAITYFLLFALSIGKVFGSKLVVKLICRLNTNTFSSPHSNSGAGAYSLKTDHGLPITNATTSTSGTCMYVHMYVPNHWSGEFL